jgi:hypothetical protein
MNPVRADIITTYAEWTAMSALRSGAPIKSRRDVYTVIGKIDFTPLFDKPLGLITRTFFDGWHRATVQSMIDFDPRLSIGWATKIVNVYLKTRCYIGAQGRHHLSEMIHPPIDAGLWEGLKERFSGHEDILAKTHCVTRIKDINEYRCYRTIIDGCRMAAALLNCKLIEVEQL